jgi:hypothetical protein
MQTRRRPLAVLGLAALLGAAGCGDASGAAAPVDPDGFEVGSGETAFEALGPGATVEIIEGSQGGYHIWISIRCGSCGPEVIASYGIDDAETGELLTFQGLQEWVRLEENDGWREAVGMIGFLTTGDPDRYVGHPVRIWASVETQGGSEPPLEGDGEATVSGVR